MTQFVLWGARAHDVQIAGRADRALAAPRRIPIVAVYAWAYAICRRRQAGW